MFHVECIKADIMTRVIGSASKFFSCMLLQWVLQTTIRWLSKPLSFHISYLRKVCVSGGWAGVDSVIVDSRSTTVLDYREVT